MYNIYQKLGKAFGVDEYELETSLNEMGITFRGYTIHVHVSKKGSKTITPKDVVEYYAHEAGNISSGCRTLAGITGDWRPIDELAKQCLSIYKVVKRKDLVKEARKHNMELRK
jgi:hypothetical protein